MKQILLIIAMLLGVTASAQAFVLDFENGTDGASVTDITGISFQDVNGYNSVYGDCRTGNYNCTSDDLGYSMGTGAYHLNGNFFLWAGPSAAATGVKVDFTNNDGTYFTTGYTSYNDFYMDAYFTDGSSTTISRPSNINNPMGYMTVTAAAGKYLDYVVLHDSGNFWLADNMSGDATGISVVPEPASLYLLGVGLLGLGFFRRKHA